MTQKGQLHVCHMSFFPILISRPKMAGPLMSSVIPDQNDFTGQYIVELLNTCFVDYCIYEVLMYIFFQQ